MPYQQVTIPDLPCPKCFQAFGLDEDEDGVTDIEWHMNQCDDPTQAEGFVEASELAGHETYDPPENWRDWVISAEDWDFDYDPNETEEADR